MFPMKALTREAHAVVLGAQIHTRPVTSQSVVKVVPQCEFVSQGEIICWFPNCRSDMKILRQTKWE